MDDFVRVGGLAAVSAALPRALRPWSDVRIMLPGYRDVVEQFTHIEIVGQCAPLAEMPACSLGRASTRDGLPIYILLCPQLYDRPGNPYGDEQGRDWPDNDVRCGLEGLLRQRSDASELTGILNGIDESWDPRACAQLAQQFAPGDWEGKQANADYVRKQFGLAVSRGPIFGLVARLVHQKGIDLVLSAADEIIEAGGQIVVTGSGEPAIEQALVEAHRRRPDAIGVVIGFNDGQARRIFAGSDFTLMPSRFEPCGLSQMDAQRFGSLPIGRQTGGLAETIVDGETGFLFSQPSTESFLGGIRRAFTTFVTKDRLNSMRQSAMAGSFGWNLTAAWYGELYRKALSS